MYLTHLLPACWRHGEDKKHGAFVQTVPVFEHFNSSQRLITVDGEKSKEEVFEATRDAVRHLLGAESGAEEASATAAAPAEDRIQAQVAASSS